MQHTKLWTGLTTLALAAALGLGTSVAQNAPDRERGVSPASARTNQPGARPALSRNTLREPARLTRSDAGLTPRARSGRTDSRERMLRPDRTLAGATLSAAPLTINRNARYDRRMDADGYDYRRRDGGWFPGLLAAPFLFPWYLIGGGYGVGYDEGPGYDYAPDYEYTYDSGPAWGPAYRTVPGDYPGPASLFGPAFGAYCATPQKTCQLYEPAEVGLGCSCRAPAGLPRFRGEVIP